MTIEEVKIRKEAVEQNIRTLLDAFEADTGVMVRSVFVCADYVRDDAAATSGVVRSVKMGLDIP